MKPVITREHGSWAVLFIPVLTGITASGVVDLPTVLFVISIFFLFMSYTPAETLLQSYYKKMPKTDKLKQSGNWFTVYISLSLLSGLPLFVFYRKYGLLLFALAAVIFFISSLFIMLSYRKNVWSDFLAMAGLTLSAPAVFYLNKNAVNFESLMLYLLNVLFFGSSAFYVHMKMRFSSLKKKDISLSEKLSAGSLNLIYHAVTIIVLMLFVFWYPSMLLAAAAFIPMVLHAVLGTFKLPRKVSFKKIGITFLAYSVVFFLMLSLVGL